MKEQRSLEGKIKDNKGSQSDSDAVRAWVTTTSKSGWHVAIKTQSSWPSELCRYNVKEKVQDEERNATSRQANCTDCAAPSQMITVKHDDGNDTNDNGDST